MSWSRCVRSQCQTFAFRDLGAVSKGRILLARASAVAELGLGASNSRAFQSLSMLGYNVHIKGSTRSAVRPRVISSAIC
jgi:hypothetical protein